MISKTHRILICRYIHKFLKQARLHAHTHTYTYACTRAHTHTLCMHAHAHSCSLTHLHTHLLTLSSSLSHLLTLSSSLTHSFTHSHTSSFFQVLYGFGCSNTCVTWWRCVSAAKTPLSILRTTRSWPSTSWPNLTLSSAGGSLNTLDTSRPDYHTSWQNLTPSPTVDVWTCSTYHVLITTHLGGISFHLMCIYIFCFSTSLSLAENVGHLSRTRHSSCQSSTTHSHRCVQCCHFPNNGMAANVWNFKHAQMLVACNCTWGLYYEQHKKVCTGRKIPCHACDSNLHQYCTWLFSQTLYQLSYIPAPMEDCFENS